MRDLDSHQKDQSKWPFVGMIELFSSSDPTLDSSYSFGEECVVYVHYHASCHRISDGLDHWTYTEYTDTCSMK